MVDFQVDKDRCIGCGNCVKVCPGGILSLDSEKKVQMRPITEFGWNGCWQCEHCLAVCPTKAISIFGHCPQHSRQPEPVEKSKEVLDALILNRHSCRRYLNKNVDPDIIQDMLDLLANAPNGGNKQQVEFTIIDDKDQMDNFRQMAYKKMEQLAESGIYPNGFDKESYSQMKEWEKTVRPDSLFCGAPHILIPHVPLGSGTPKQDAVIAGTYFELLCASRGLGAVMMTYPLDALCLMPEVMELLEIPKDHMIPLILGFGYPEISYKRGVQKKIDPSRIHRLSKEFLI